MFWTQHDLSDLVYIFNQFDLSESIELVGKDTVTKYRLLRLRAVTKSLGSEKAIGKDISDGTGRIAEAITAIELQTEQPGETVGYRMIIDEDEEGSGIRTEPHPPPPPFRAFYQSSGVPRIMEPVADLDINGKKQQILQILRVIDPRLKDIKSEGLMLYGDIDTGSLIPLPVLGGTMARLASLALYILNAPNGVVLVDEIENGLHYSVMFKVWKAVALAARESDTQVFATTHSWECIKAAHQAFTLDGKYDFRLHRLGWIDGKIGAVTYDQETLDAAIKAGLEVR